MSDALAAFLVALPVLAASSGLVVRVRLRTVAGRRGRDRSASDRTASHGPRGARRTAAGAEIDAVLLLALVEAALATGAAVPHGVAAVGRAVGGAAGAALTRAGSALVLGAAWESAWADAPASLGPVRDALHGAWLSGAPPAAGLRARADRIRRERRRAVRTASARLAVHLVVPLGACFLPAFVLIGLVPIVLSSTEGLAVLR